MPVGFPRPGVTVGCGTIWVLRIELMSSSSSAMNEPSPSPEINVYPELDMFPSQLGRADVGDQISPLWLHLCHGRDEGGDPIGWSERHPPWGCSFLLAPGCVEARWREMGSGHSNSLSQETSCRGLAFLPLASPAQHYRPSVLSWENAAQVRLVPHIFTTIHLWSLEPLCSELLCFSFPGHCLSYQTVFLKP